MNIDSSNILIIAPHADDDILGCGGLISRVTRNGGTINIAVVNMESHHRLDEMKDSLGTLTKIPEIYVFGYHPDGLDTVPVKEIASWIDYLLEELHPDILIMPDIGAAHQDHRRSAEASIIACRPSSGTSKHRPSIVLSYEVVADAWPARQMISPQMHISLSDTDAAFKADAMQRHVSQSREYPSERSRLAILSLTSVRGAQSGFDYAESYNVIRIAVE